MRPAATSPVGPAPITTTSTSVTLRSSQLVLPGANNLRGFVAAGCRGGAARPDPEVKGTRQGRPPPEETTVKYMLIMQVNAAVLDALPEAEQEKIGEGHGAFMATTTESGELVSTYALGDPSISAVVRIA